MTFQVSYIKAVDVYFIVSFAFVFAVVFEYVLVLLNTGIKRQRRVSSTYLSGNNNEANGSKVILAFRLDTAFIEACIQSLLKR